MTKPAKCSICRKIPKPTCDWKQGRCPHRATTISTTVIKTRLQNLINFFKGK